MNNISKIVLSGNDGKRIGYILDIAVDYNTLQKIGYYIVDEESEGEFFVKLEDIKTSSDTYVLIDDISSLIFSNERKASLIGKVVLDENCQSYGVVKCIHFAGALCQKIVTDRCEILPRFVKKVGQDCVFVSFKRKKNIENKLAFQRENVENIVVKIQDNSSYSIPEKINLSSRFYIGKISTQNIFGYNNEKIVMKDEIITKNVVEKARKHNKLNQLFFAIKR